MKYKAIALDLDGTLTDHNKNLPEKNRKAVEQAADRGVKIILASGRPLFGITAVAEMLDLQHRGGYILAYNGGNIVDCQSGNLIVSKWFPEDCVADVCTLARENDVYALTYDRDRIVAESDTDEYVIRETICNSTTVKRVDNLNVYVNYPVAKFLVVGEHKKLLCVQDELLARHGRKIDAFFSEDYFLEVVPMNVAKDKSLHILLDMLGIQPRELIACGDGMNDIPMLKMAGLAAVMENAYPTVKEYADYIAPSNDNAGVADVIERFILGCGI